MTIDMTFGKTINGFPRVTVEGPWHLFGNYLSHCNSREQILEIQLAVSEVLSGTTAEALLSDDYIELTLSHKKMTAHLIMDKPVRKDYESEIPLQLFSHLVTAWSEYLKICNFQAD